MSAKHETERSAGLEEHGRHTLVGRWLSCLWQTVQAIRLYDLDHPVVWERADEALAAWHACAGGALLVTLTPEGFTFENRAIEPDDTLEALARQLHGHNVAALEFSDGLTQDQVVALAQGMGRSATHAIDQQPFERRIGEATDDRVRVTSLDCDRLGRRDGARHDGAAAGPNWQHLVHSTLDASDDAPVSPDALADQVNAAAQDVDLDELRQALERSTTAPDPDGSQQVRRFVGSLNPQMRQKLFSATPGDGNAALSFVGEVVDVLETDEIVAAMNSVQLKGLQVSPETLRMCRKLAQCLGQTERSEEDRGTLRDELKQLEDQLSLLGGFSLDDLTEIFERRSTEQFTPDDYRDQLNTLAGAGEDDAQRNIDEAKYVAQAESHAAEVAVMTLETTDTADRGECDGALRYLAESMGKLIAEGRLLTVQEAVEQAERWSGCECQATHEAACDLKDSFESEPIIQALLTRVAESQAMAEQATQMLRCSSASIAAAVFLRLNGITDPQACGRLHGVLDSAEPAVLQSAVGELVKRGEDTDLTAVLRYGRMAAQGQAAPLMQMLIKHPRAEVCVSAAKVLHDRQWVQSSTIGRWLTEPHETVRNYAVECLVARDDDASIEQLGELLDGRMGDGATDIGLITHVVATAAQRSPRVLSRACRALLRLTESMKPSNARHARRLAVALAAHGKTEEVRQSIAGWRFSGTRLIGCLYEGGAWCIRAVKR